MTKKLGYLGCLGFLGFLGYVPNLEGLFSLFSLFSLLAFLWNPPRNNLFEMKINKRINLSRKNAITILFVSVAVATLLSLPVRTLTAFVTILVSLLFSLVIICVAHREPYSQ